jgi:hypothetical protein
MLNEGNSGIWFVLRERSIPIILPSNSAVNGRLDRFCQMGMVFIVGNPCDGRNDSNVDDGEKQRVNLFVLVILRIDALFEGEIWEIQE